jgi:hypothetical protein
MWTTKCTIFWYVRSHCAPTFWRKVLPPSSGRKSKPCKLQSNVTSYKTALFTFIAVKTANTTTHEPHESTPWHSIRTRCHSSAPTSTTGLRSGNTLDLCSAGAWFESQQGHRLSSVLLLNPSRQRAGQYFDEPITAFFQILSNSYSILCSIDPASIEK